MRRLHLKWLATFGILLGLGCAAQFGSAQEAPPDAVPVSIVVSVEARHGKEIPAVDNKEDVRAFAGKERLRVAEWVPLQGANADLELLLLIDDASRETLALQYDDLRQFINAQPPTTAIAVGYIEYGSVRMAQNFTKDREAANKALRIPLGPFAAESSPYLAVSDVIKHWPENKSRHAIFLISSGIDPLQPGYVDTYLDSTIAIAQRTGTAGQHDLRCTGRPFRPQLLEIQPRARQPLAACGGNRRRIVFPRLQHTDFVHPVSERVCHAAQPPVPADGSDEAGQKALLPPCATRNRSAGCGSRDGGSSLRSRREIDGSRFAQTNSVLFPCVVGRALSGRASARLW